jgi:hypothetical protein
MLHCNVNGERSFGAFPPYELTAPFVRGFFCPNGPFACARRIKAPYCVPGPKRGKIIYSDSGARMFAALPLLALPVIGYNLLVFAILPGGRNSSAVASLSKPLFVFPTVDSGQWPVTLEDMIVFISLIILFFEQLKTTERRHVVILNQSMSMVLFIGCLVEFLLFPAFANSAFFLVSAMVLLDVVAGFIATLRTEMGV